MDELESSGAKLVLTEAFLDGRRRAVRRAQVEQSLSARLNAGLGRG